MTQDTVNTRSVVKSFRHYDADEVKDSLDHVSGWVPAQNVNPLLNEVDDAKVQYYDDNGNWAFVTTL